MPPSCLSAADKNWCGNFADIGSAGYPRTKIMGGATAAQAFAFHAFVDCDLLPNQSRRGREPRHATLRFAGPFDLPVAFRVPSLLLDCLFELGVTTFRRRSICRPDAGVPGLFGCGRANTDRS